MESHGDLIRDQFTKQARPFSEAPAIRDEDALRLLVEFTGAASGDEVLDVACGPGLVASAFARVVRRVEGIDLTPAMIDLARSMGRERGLENLSFRIGDVVPLPYPDGSFSIVISRFSFHHFPDPAAVFAEMEGLFGARGLGRPRGTSYLLETELEDLLSRSFPGPGGADEVRRRIAGALEDDGLGIPVRREGGRTFLAYPIAVLAADKPGPRRRSAGHPGLNEK